MSTQKKHAVERSSTKKLSEKEHLGCRRVQDKHFLKRVRRRYLVANYCSRIFGWIWCATKRDNNGSRLPCVCAFGGRLAVNLRFCVGWRGPLGFRGTILLEDFALRKLVVGLLQILARKKNLLASILNSTICSTCFV